jgi:hypothetical protein
MTHHTTFDEYELYENTRRFIFLPRTCSRSPAPPVCNYENVLVLDRNNGAFKEFNVPEERRDDFFSGMDSMTRIFGIVGTVTLLSGNYLIVILRREYIGEIRGNEIYRLKEVQFLPVNKRTLNNISEDQAQKESVYRDMINKVLCEEDSFYFSYTSNLCVDFQDTLTDNQTPYASKHFFWNCHFSKPLHQAGMDKFVLPMIRGLVELTDATISDKTFRFGLIARTGCKRAGTRYNCRGADTDGNVANFVEVEHFIDYDGVFSSFRQIRGSIPFQWTQFAENLKYTPEIRFDSTKIKVHQQTILKHFNDLNRSFPGPVVAINLCKKKMESQERRLSDMYEKLITGVEFEQKYVKYIHFDLHHECKNLDFTKLDELIESLSSNFEDISYFMHRYAPSEADGTDVKLLSFDDEEPKVFRPQVMSIQTGLFRVNCVDCCDRTNVVKTYISRHVFIKQLYDMGIIRRRTASLIAYPQLERIFNHFWSSIGDRISTLYTGTGALMGDYTRTGQRSMKGLMNDGLNSVTRYVKNNFIDEVRQRSIHLVLGKLDLNSAEEAKAFVKMTDVISDSLFGTSNTSTTVY